MAPTVVDKKKKETLVEAQPVAGKYQPVPPDEDGDGTVFVSIASYRDGERCGATLQSIFENADDPSKVFVGLAEQNAPDDAFCLEEYCKKYGTIPLKRDRIRTDVTKLMIQPEGEANCPHYDQVRLVAYHDINAKGPMVTRSMVRKVLGNEEYCMQIDAHTTFAKHWDTQLKKEWKMTQNEFAVLSTVPAPLDLKDKVEIGGPGETEVPRTCQVFFRDNGFPDYDHPADSYAKDLETPLLSYAWSAAFSFAKCHLEESVPYDNFAPYAMPVEQFSRYARMWTRGYDTYTPTRNYVFHDYGKQENGHGDNEWFKHHRDRFRVMTIERMKTALQMPGGDESAAALANLGLYGVGKRRTVDQLQEFAHISLEHATGNQGSSEKCANLRWVPYSATISPIANMLENADNLDPQPEYPLRTAFKYYQQVEEEVAPLLKLDLAEEAEGLQQSLDSFGDGAEPLPEASNLPSLPLLLVFWIFGLVVACVMADAPKVQRGARKGRSRRKAAMAKDV